MGKKEVMAETPCFILRFRWSRGKRPNGAWLHAKWDTYLSVDNLAPGGYASSRQDFALEPLLTFRFVVLTITIAGVTESRPTRHTEV